MASSGIALHRFLSGRRPALDVYLRKSCLRSGDVTVSISVDKSFTFSALNVSISKAYTSGHSNLDSLRNVQRMLEPNQRKEHDLHMELVRKFYYN